MAGVLDAAENAVDFRGEVLPILSKSCFACHGNDEKTREADLRLDVRAEAIRDYDGARPIVPGNGDASEVMARITSEDEDERMPPADHGQPLSSAQVDLLRHWIEQGAPYDAHWAFVPPKQADMPDVALESWSRNAIDHFVLAELERRSMKPSDEADRYVLIRRLYLDLIGLPPTPVQVDSFVNDDSDGAYDKVVDQLLKSPRFGERWAQMWLDLARYADSMGYEKDLPRTIWRYRDWVIDAFNDDMPFDQFTIEQLAGDLLPDATLEQKLATALHRNTLTNQEGGTDDEEFRVAAVKDRVDTTLQVWMGLTMGCAKCHSHKYDPITQRDYYQFYAFFNQTADRDLGDDSPTLLTPTADQSKEMARLDEQISKLEQAATKDDARQKELEAFKKQRAAIKPPKTPVMQELPPNKRRTTHIQVRGNFLERGDAVEGAVPAAFGKLPKGAPSNRLGIGKWLVQRDNPLTARVQVNRIWSRLFGRGIVLSEEDFGTQGVAPTHPELLDWLAVEFMNRGWSLKQLLRLIVNSATYRQSSHVTEELAKADLENRWLARGPRFRLEAEIVRDQALAAAGILSDKTHGPSVMPPQPPGIWKITYSALKWQTSQGDDRHRRSIYTYWRRTSPYPSMLTFDAGTRETCVLRRVRTNTPLQALITLNDPVYVEAAAGLAGRMVTLQKTTQGERAAHGFRLAAVRPPDKLEQQRLVQVLEEARRFYRQHEDEAEKLIKSGMATAPDGVPAVEFASWIVLANVILNLDEVIARP